MGGSVFLNRFQGGWIILCVPGAALRTQNGLEWEWKSRKAEAELTNGPCWRTTTSPEEGKKKPSEQEMNLPHSSWLECTPTRKAAIILWPAHVGIHRVVRSAFSWLAERGQGLFVPWLVLSRMQLSSKHFGSLFGYFFVMWKCVHVCKLVWVTLVRKLDVFSDFILFAESQIRILNPASEAAGRWILW